MTEPTDPGARRDLDIVTHGALALALLTATFILFRVVVPWLVNRHDTASLLAAVILMIGGSAFAYLAGRHLWRSLTTITEGDEE